MAYSGNAAQRLVSVQEAIDRCLTSQDYTIRGRRQTMAALSTLREMEKDLLREAGLEAQGQGPSLGQNVPVR
jgi:hypothetical protein